MSKKKKQKYEPETRPKEFLDCIAPSVIQFNPDHYICGCTYRSCWVLRGYPTTTSEQALLQRLGEHDGVTLRIYIRRVTPAEEKAILHRAANRNRMDQSNSTDMKRAVNAVENLRDMETVSRQREPLLHCAVYIDLSAPGLRELKELQNEIAAELIRSKLNVDQLFLRQQEGFLCANPAGHNALGEQFERVLPASSAANLFPFNYSGKTDPNGFFIGKALYGGNIIVDFDRRADDKTNASILILGNSGQGKSYLLKLLLCNFREAGKAVIALDSEHELKEQCGALSGCFVDLLNGQYRINLLEPKCWNDGSEPDDPDEPAAFRGSSKLSQHISFLRDIFHSYKDFDIRHIDVLELMVGRLYQKWGITDETDFSRMAPTEYPILSDLYDCIEEAYRTYDQEAEHLYPAEFLRDLLLGLHSMCRGADSRFFNGHTNITSARFLVFGVRGLDDVARNLRTTLLFNLLSYMSDQLLTAGNTVAALDELYLWLDDPVTVTYIRNALKRVRKRDSALLLASQNLEDFDRPGIRELTRPLFAIPTHQFLFYAGAVDKRFYMENLQLEPSEYEHIRFPRRAVCLYKCGNERYLMKVEAPPHKAKLIGESGGK